MGPNKINSQLPTIQLPNLELGVGSWIGGLRSSLEECPQLAAPRRVAELPQRLGFDLPDALAGDREALADLFQRVLAAIADAEPHFDHLLLARRQRLQYRLRLLLEVQVDHRVGRGHD